MQFADPRTVPPQRSRRVEIPIARDIVGGLRRLLRQCLLDFLKRHLDREGVRVLATECTMQVAKRIEAARRIEDVEQITERRAVTAQVLLGVRDPVVRGLCVFFLCDSMHEKPPVHAGKSAGWSAFSAASRFLHGGR